MPAYPNNGDTPPNYPPAQIAAEICARLLEWRDSTSQVAVSRWLLRLSSLHMADPNALWLYIAWQTGDTAEIAKSFDDRGRESGTSRQCAEQITSRAMDSLARLAPELAVAMRETFQAHSPEARAVGNKYAGSTPPSGKESFRGVD
jgi:hypothetical protein